MVKWRGFAFGLAAIAAGTALAQQAVKLGAGHDRWKAGSGGSRTGRNAGRSAVAGGHELNKTDVDAWLDGFMPYALERGDIAGAVVVVVKDGQVLTAAGLWLRRRRKAHAGVDPESTLFRPGSVSKLFTWTAVMQLVEQGKLDLDADVNKYLDFKIPPRERQADHAAQHHDPYGGLRRNRRGISFTTIPTSWSRSTSS